MKILHLNTTLEGGAGHFSNDLIRFLDKRGHKNQVLTFADFLKKGFLKMNISVLLHLIKSYLIIKFRVKKNTKVISPTFSLWSKNKINAIVITYDLVIIHRFSNFLSYEEIIRIIKKSKKAIIIGIDEGLFTPYCTYTFECENFKKSCQNCPVSPKRNHKKIVRNYLKIKNQLLNADFSNSEILVANNHEKNKILTSFWKNTNIKISTSIFPYQLIMSDNEHVSVLSNKIKFFDDKLIITFSALFPSYRKGFDLINTYLQNLHNFYPIESNKKIEINIITNDNSFLLEKSLHPNIKLKFHTILNKKAFELLLANSHIFLSFSRADSGPYTLNICYYLHTMILSFNVGVAVELAKKTKSIRIIDNFSAEKMAIQTLKIMLKSKSDIKSILNYKKDLFWI